MGKSTESVIITIVDNSMTCIENFKSIMCYEDNELKINTYKGPVEIKGDNLSICYFDDEEILIKGHIHSIIFMDGSV